MQISIGDIYHGGSVVDVTTTSTRDGLVSQTVRTVRQAGVNGQETREYVDGELVHARIDDDGMRVDDSTLRSQLRSHLFSIPPLPKAAGKPKVIECIACGVETDVLMCGLCKEAISVIRSQWISGYVADIEKELT